MNKKIFLFSFIVLIGSTCVANNDDNDTNDTEVSSATFKAKAIACIKKGFQAIDATLNYILSPKGLIKVGIIISPLIYMYCKYKKINLFKSAATKIVREAATARKFYEHQIELGKNDAAVETFKQSPWGVISLGFFRTIGVAVTNGIPFILALYVKKKMDAR